MSEQPTFPQTSSPHCPALGIFKSRFLVSKTLADPHGRGGLNGLVYTFLGDGLRDVLTHARQMEKERKETGMLAPWPEDG